MKVAFVCSSLGNVAGGIETTVLHLSTDVAQRHEVVLLRGTRSYGRTAVTLPNVPEIALPYIARSSVLYSLGPSRGVAPDPFLVESATLFASFSISSRAKRALQTADIVSTHTKYDSLFFSRWAARRGIPSVFHVQGSRFGPLFQRLDRSNRYVAVSELTKRTLSERFNLPIASTVTPGVPDDLLRAHRKEEDFILFVARLQQSKGTVRILRIFGGIADEFPETKLVVVGDGPDRELMTAEVGRCGLSNRVTFTGSLPHEAVLPFYSRAKLLLFPSDWEVYPLVPLESMAAACPVIATDIPAIAEATGGNGILLPRDDLEAWNAAVRTLLDSPEKRRRIGEQGRNWAAEHTWSKVARQYETELLRAINS